MTQVGFPPMLRRALPDMLRRLSMQMYDDVLEESLALNPHISQDFCSCFVSVTTSSWRIGLSVICLLPMAHIILKSSDDRDSERNRKD